MLLGLLCVAACGPEANTVDQACVSLAELAEQGPAEVVPEDWRAVISQIEVRLKDVDTRYARLDLAIYVGTSHARDNRVNPGWPYNEFEGDAIALLEQIIAGDGDITRDAWLLRIFDVQDRLFLEIQQLPGEPSTTYAHAVSSLAVSGGILAKCADCFPRLSEIYGTQAPIIDEATFTGTWGSGAEQVVDVQLDLAAVDETEVGLLPLWLSNFYHTDKRGDEIFQIDYVDGEIVLQGGLISEPYPVPAGLSYDACSRDVAYSVTAYISEECNERYGARDLAVHAPTLCCWNECFDCPERYCLDPAEYDF